MRTGQPCPRSKAFEDSIDLTSGAHVHSARGLIEEQRPRLQRKPLADGHLLLIPAGKRLGDLAIAGATHVQVGNLSCRDESLAPSIHKAGAGPA